MRYQRLTLQAGGAACTVSLHPRLTIVSGVGQQEREGLIGELLGALAGTRRGSTLELLLDDGHRLVVQRGAGADADAVRDKDGGADVTEAFRTPDGRVDLLAADGLSITTARRRCRLSGADVAAAGQADAHMARLARCDQPALWQTAERLQATDAFLRDEAVSIGASSDDAEVIQLVEERHQAFEAAQAQLEKVRHFGVFTGGACAVGAAPAAFMNKPATLGFLAVASLTLALGIIFRRRKEKAAVAEREALTAAGAETYIGFHIQRMNDLLEQQANRKRVAAAAAAHREALADWKELAGEAAVDWALEHRDAIGQAHRRLAAGVPADIDVLSLGLGAVEPAELASTLVTRMADLRHAGRTGESLPLILDDPFLSCEPTAKQWLLELVGRSAGSPQVIYVTEDPDVEAWARIEALSGTLSVLAPAVAAVPEPALA